MLTAAALAASFASANMFEKMVADQVMNYAGLD